MKIVTRTSQNVNLNGNHTKPTLPPLLQPLAAQIDAGAFVRCPSCYGWVNHNKIHSLVLFMPNSGGAHVAYAICKRCWRKSQQSHDDQTNMVQRIENYLLGGAQ